MKKLLCTFVTVSLASVVLSTGLAQTPVQINITNTIQGAFTDNAEVPFGQDVGYQEIAGGLELDDTTTEFVYDIAVTETGLSLTWVSNENNDQLARVIEEGTFDRYYIRFDQPVLAGASVVGTASLVPDIISMSASELVIQVGPGMEVGPGFDAELVFELADTSAATPVHMTIKNTFQGSFSNNIEVPFGNNSSMVLADSMHLDSSLTAFVYDVRINDGTLSMAWISNEDNDQLARVLEEGTFDRYYITFSEDILNGASVNAASILSPNITSVTANSLLIEVGAGMQVGPGQDITIDLDIESSAMANMASGGMMQNAVIEVINFRLLEGVTEDQFLELNTYMETTYVSQQPGFISRETSVTEAGDWQINVHWQTMQDSEQSMAGFNDADGAEAFFALMQMDTLTLLHRFVK
ncbi:MAG: hypothetical protein AAF708_18430 [Deinococcota bacterium]